MPVLSRSGGMVTGFRVQAAWLLGFAFKRRGYWVRVQAAWLLGSRSGGVVVGFASGGVVTGFASGGVVVGSVEWVLSLRDLLTALSPNPSAAPHKNARVFVGCGQWGRGFIRRQAA